MYVGASFRLIHARRIARRQSMMSGYRFESLDVWNVAQSTIAFVSASKTFAEAS